ncbi:hypothetical protein, conserved [Eimeria brunetti]|uniref:Uncharacterized protein n=1 Tax=Eimeria brunetti TaxID=51314 RepID=U6L9A9_9EIME|nr:hypothetical protein, conserved [Eimeria brunetti]
MLLRPSPTPPKNEETPVNSSEPPLTFVGPKVLIYRKRNGGVGTPMGPVKAIRTVVRKIKEKRANRQNQRQQQQSVTSSVPTPRTDTLSNTTEPPSDRLLREQDLEAASVDNNSNESSRTEQIKAAAAVAATAGPQQQYPAVFTPTVTHGMRKGFALPHDCPTIIEGEEWGSGDCSDPDDITPSLSSSTHTPLSAGASAAATTLKAAAAAAAAVAALETTALHTQTPTTLDAAILQSGSSEEDERRRYTSGTAEWHWHTATINPWRSSSRSQASQGGLNPAAAVCNSRALPREQHRSYTLDMQEWEHANERLAAAAEGTADLRGATAQAEQRPAAAAATGSRNPMGAQPEQGEEQQQHSGGSASLIARVMERVVSVLEGSAALLSSCGAGDIIDESQLVVSNGRMHLCGSSRSSNTADIQETGSTPGIQTCMQQQEDGKSDETGNKDGNTNMQRERIEEDMKPEDKSCNGKPRNEDDDASRISGTTCRGNELKVGKEGAEDGKKEDKEEKEDNKEEEKREASAEKSTVEGDEEREGQEEENSGKALTEIKEKQNMDSDRSGIPPPRVQSLSEVHLLLRTNQPNSTEQALQLSSLPPSNVMQLCGAYLTSCTTEGARLHIQHYESSQVNIARCTATFAGLGKEESEEIDDNWRQQTKQELLRQQASVEDASKNTQIGRGDEGASKNKTKSKVCKAAAAEAAAAAARTNMLLQGLPMTPGMQE